MSGSFLRVNRKKVRVPLKETEHEDFRKQFYDSRVRRKEAKAGILRQH